MRKHTILVIDNNIHNCKTLGAFIEDSGYIATLADSVELAFKALEKEHPSLIFLNALMPGNDGCQIVSDIKSSEKYGQIPLILIDENMDTDGMVKGYELGAADYLSKPLDYSLLKAKIKTYIDFYEKCARLMQANTKLAKENEAMNKANKLESAKNNELNEALSVLYKTLNYDSLTGLCNKRHMLEKIEAEISRCKRTKRPFGIITTDIDNFKKIINDYGRECGDFVLKSLSANILTTVRDADCLSRWKEADFLMLVIEIDADDALSLGERVRYQIERMPVIYEGHTLRITVTVGVTVYDPETDSLDDVLSRADCALAAGKKNGRNRVVIV